ncbi:MAG: hypothetical protein PHQ34_09735 [Methanothrix sp.]|nr:hypothetical protein [Methanothrix sp.]
MAGIMRSVFRLLIIGIIFLLIFTSIVDCVWIPSRPKEVSPVPTYSASTQIHPDQGIGEGSKSGGSSSSLGSSLPAGFDPNDYSSDQIQIYQTISPNNNRFLPIKKYKIKIDMKGVRRELRNILIMEKVDSGIIIDSLESPVIYDRFNSSDHIFLNKTDYYLKNNTIFLNVSKWKPQYHITYSYNITTPGQIGIYGLQTNVRFIDAEPKIQDTEYNRDIEVKPYEFEVNVDAERLNIYAGTPMVLNYYIKNSYPCSLDAYPCKIVLETSDQYDIYLDRSCYNSRQKYNGSIIKNWIISSDNYTVVRVIIVHKQSGSRLLPTITIEDDPSHFDKEIVVEDRVFRLIEQYYPALSILLVILSLFFYGLEIRYLGRELAQKHGHNPKTRNYREIAIFVLIAALITIISGIFLYTGTSSLPHIVFSIILIVCIVGLVILTFDE